MNKEIVRVLDQGAPVVNCHGVSEIIKENIVLLEIDMRSKNCEVKAYANGPSVFIGSTEYSVDLNENGDPDEWTWVDFPKYNGWEIFLSDISRYTLRMCLINR